MAETTTLHLSGGDGAEVERAIEICCLGVSVDTPATFSFSKADDLSAYWQSWIHDAFLPIFRPAFCSIHQHGEAFEIQEIIAEDLHLDRNLSAALRMRSMESAGRFLEGKEEMQQNREWSRFAAAVEEGKTPGHLVTVAALQTVLYHLALLPALTAYAWLEFESAFSATNLRASENGDVFLQIAPHLTLADSEISGEDDSHAGGNGGLRVV